MKTIRKNILLLAFAAGALFVIGNNVLAEIVGINAPMTTNWGCQGQRGIARWDAFDNCFCLHDPEVNSGNRCSDSHNIANYQ